MNDDIETALKKIQEQIRLWDIHSIIDGSSVDKIETAKTLQIQLTILKMMIGIDKFDELPAFSRYLRNVTLFLNKLDYEQEIKK